MPELPEVETTRRGIEPFLAGKRLKKVTVHDSRLRWPVSTQINKISNCCVHAVDRRGKYILLRLTSTEPRRKHDHVEFVLDNKTLIRYHDPRRFGCVLWHDAAAPEEHKLLSKLGPEPLSNDFNAEQLFKSTRNRQVAIKNLIMNSEIVVGVGNIYASESLFMAGIRPGRAAKRITKKEASTLVSTIKQVLERSIKQGGTTLRDFINSDGNPGYFAQQLQVYGRTDEPCRECSNPIRQKIMGQRSTFYCPQCQK